MAQIAMIRHELVDEERWTTPERFHRVLAVYQVLPGPEAHELCVYFGMLVRGRPGGLLAGLGFMLPGFCLMMLLSWAYVRWGISSAAFTAVFLGCQPAVVAVVVRAVHRIGTHALTDRVLWGIAIAVGAATMLGASFLVTLPLAGLACTLLRRVGPERAAAHLLGFFQGVVPAAAVLAPSTLALFGYGLRSGLLTFGGAYTVIPFLQHDAVVRGGWLTNAQFLDGIALAGILPAPLVIFSTFVGYLGGGPWGAVAMTAGVFVPAFAFTLVGHRYVEALVANRSAHALLDGVTAGVVGIIAVTAIGLFRDVVTGIGPAIIFALALFLAFRWKARAAVVGIIAGAGAAGWILMSMRQ